MTKHNASSNGGSTDVAVRSVAMRERPLADLADADLASEINREHAACERSYKDAVTRAIACGHRLIEAKKRHGKHTEWLPVGDREHHVQRPQGAGLTRARCRRSSPAPRR